MSDYVVNKYVVEGYLSQWALLCELHKITGVLEESGSLSRDAGTCVLRVGPFSRLLPLRELREGTW